MCISIFKKDLVATYTYQPGDDLFFENNYCITFKNMLECGSSSVY